MSRIAFLLSAFFVPAATLFMPSVAQAQPQVPFCGITWGSLQKTAPPMVQDHITATRAGGHSCYDRLSIDMGGIPVSGYNARYVAHCRAEESGQIKPVRGGAIVQVGVRAPAAASFPANKANLNDVTGFKTFRQIRSAGSFEGITQICIGIRARLPFRLLKLHNSVTGNGILTVDVAHRWQQ